MPESPPTRARLLDLERAELAELIAELGAPRFRADQIYHWLHQRRAESIDTMQNLPGKLRDQLAARYTATGVTIDRVFTSTDGTRRYLLRLDDGQQVETVFMPEERRDTICVSSQVGCALACDFCMTGVLGLKRNLSVGEIVGQVTVVLNEVYGRGVAPPHGTNLVLMGMGEPLHNYDPVLSAIRRFADEDGLAIAPRRVTLSTAGLVPQIEQLSAEPIRPRLAISLTAANDELRDRLFPINRKYPLHELLDACRRFPLSARDRLTFEYVLLDGVNDSDRDADELVGLLRPIRAKVNLIPHNPAPELPYGASPPERIERFQQRLTSRGLPAFIRRPRGQDIAAACGQLAARQEAAPVQIGG